MAVFTAVFPAVFTEALRPSDPSSLGVQLLARDSGGKRRAVEDQLARYVPGIGARLYVLNRWEGVRSSDDRIESIHRS